MERQPNIKSRETVEEMIGRYENWANGYLTNPAIAQSERSKIAIHASEFPKRVLKADPSDLVRYNGRISALLDAWGFLKETYAR